MIKIAPGDYTETSNVVLKTYVDVEGSGQNTTTINCACSNTAMRRLRSFQLEQLPLRSATSPSTTPAAAAS
ncbi:hypothetical protein [uncultured Ilumatobacter sp.]|uniref:hypothetical protein n=1 Tax=uncultured Ilumatobacter sp. TaxID=879968 RepID=UPI00374EB84B